MAVVVEPDAFAYVDFDAAGIAAVVEQLVVAVGLPDSLDVRVVIDETVPSTRARLTGTDPVTIELESGAVEDPKRVRVWSPDAVVDVVGRLLFAARDRRNTGVGPVPPDDELSPALRCAWDTYCAGRLARAVGRDRRGRDLYAFRLRHGFSDAADSAFELLWGGVDLTWGDVAALSEQARSATGAIAPR